jgi:molecular chaperone HtpG
VLLLPDPVDSFWVTSAASFEGKPFKSVTQGAADLAQIPRLDAKNEPQSETDAAMATFLLKRASASSAPRRSKSS